MIEDTRYSSPNTHAHEGFSECAITRGNWGIIVSPPLPSPPLPSRRTRARVERVGELEKVFEINASRYTSFVFSRTRTNETENYIGRVSTNVRASMRVIHAPISFEKKTGSLPPPPETLANHVQRRSVKSFRRKIHFASETTIC